MRPALTEWARYKTGGVWNKYDAADQSRWTSYIFVETWQDDYSKWSSLQKVGPAYVEYVEACAYWLMHALQKGKQLPAICQALYNDLTPDELVALDAALQQKGEKDEQGNQSEVA